MCDWRTDRQQEAPSGARTQHVLNGDVITNNNINDEINQDDEASIVNDEYNDWALIVCVKCRYY